MKEKVDLRVIKTKKAIKDAFLTLIKDKDYSKITIQNIANEALINRNTFYLHYLDKDDLLDQLTAECMDKLEYSMNSYEGVDNINDLTYDIFKEINNRMLRAINKDIEFYQIILSNNSIPYLEIKLRNVLKNHMSKGNVTSEKEFYIEYIVSGLIGVIRHWIKNPVKYTVDQISDMIIKLYSKDIIDLLKI